MVPVLFSTTYTFTKGPKIGKSKSGRKAGHSNTHMGGGGGRIEVKVILGYISSSKENWATEDPVTNNTKQVASPTV